MPIYFGDYQRGGLLPDRDFDSGESWVRPGMRLPTVVLPQSNDEDEERYDPYSQTINDLNTAATDYNRLVQQHRDTNVDTPELRLAADRYFGLLREVDLPPGASTEIAELQGLVRQSYSPNAEMESQAQSAIGRGLDDSGSQYSPFAMYSDAGLDPGRFTLDYLERLGSAGRLNQVYQPGQRAESQSFQFDPGRESFTFNRMSADLPGYSPEGLSYQYRDPVYDPFGDTIQNRYWALQSDEGQRSWFLPDAPYVMQGYADRFAGDSEPYGVTFDPSRERTNLGFNPTPAELADLVPTGNKAGLSNAKERFYLPLEGSQFESGDYEVGRGFDAGESVAVPSGLMSADFSPLMDRGQDSADEAALRSRFQQDDRGVSFAYDNSRDGARQRAALSDIMSVNGGLGEASGRQDDLQFLGGEYDVVVDDRNLQDWWTNTLDNLGMSQFFRADDVRGQSGTTVSTGSMDVGFDNVGRPGREQDRYILPDSFPDAPDQREEFVPADVGEIYGRTWDVRYNGNVPVNNFLIDYLNPQNSAYRTGETVVRGANPSLFTWIPQGGTTGAPFPVDDPNVVLSSTALANRTFDLSGGDNRVYQLDDGRRYAELGPNAYANIPGFGDTLYGFLPDSLDNDGRLQVSGLPNSPGAFISQSALTGDSIGTVSDVYGQNEQVPGYESYDGVDLADNSTRYEWVPDESGQLRLRVTGQTRNGNQPVDIANLNQSRLYVPRTAPLFGN